MPLIEVKAFAGRFGDPGQTQRVMAGRTGSGCDVFGEEVRAETWVVVEGVESSNWGFGGEVRK